MLGLVDAFAMICFAVVVGLLFAMPVAAYQGIVRRWVFELCLFIVALSGLAALQYPGRGAFIFNFLALGLFLAVCAVSAVAALSGRHDRTRRSAREGE